MLDKHKIGKKGEDYAASLLKRKGYKILERNFHCPFGELDIVATQANTLVFVEVKTRSSKEYGSPEESIVPRKIKSIIKSGQFFRLRHKNLPESERIDLVAIEMTKQGKITRSEIIQNIS